MRPWYLAPLLAACSGTATTEPAGPDPQASAVAAQNLCYIFQHAGDECRASQDLVEAGTRTLKVEATIEQQLAMSGGATRYVGFEVKTGGKTAMHRVRILGKGAGDKAGEQAVQRAAQEWAALAGTALVDSVRDDGTSTALVAGMKAGSLLPADAAPTPAISVGPFHAYPGIPDIRGAMQGGPSMDHAGLLAAMESQLAGLDGARLHTLQIIIRNDGAVTCESVEVDGSADMKLCGVVGAFGWPSPASPYGVKQVYQLVPGPAPATKTGDPEPPSGDTDR